MQLVQGLYSDKDLAKALELTEVIDFHQTLDIDGIKASRVVPFPEFVAFLPGGPLGPCICTHCCSDRAGAIVPLQSTQEDRGGTMAICCG